MASNLPTVVKTYQGSYNNTTASQGSAIATYQLMWSLLIPAMLAVGSAPWTMYYSCNGTTAGTPGDGVNRITSALFPQGSAQIGWFVLYNATLGIYFCYICGANGQGLEITQKMSFSSSAYTGGAITGTGPTATNEIILVNTSNANVLGSFNGQLRWSYVQSTDAQCCRIIVAGNSVIQGQIFFEKLTNIVTGTPGYSNTGIVGYANLFGNTIQAQTRTNSITSTFSASVETAAQIALASEVDGNYPLLPVGAVGTTVGTRGKWGMFQDMWLGSAAANAGDTYPGAAETPLNQFVQLNNQIVIPWNQGAFSLV